jgi:hypothetical protein
VLWAQSLERWDGSFSQILGWDCPLPFVTVPTIVADWFYPLTELTIRSLHKGPREGGPHVVRVSPLFFAQGGFSGMMQAHWQERRYSQRFILG